MLVELCEYMLTKMRKNKVAKHVLELMYDAGLTKPYRAMLYKYYEKNPTESMKKTMEESCRYFESHKQDIEEIMGWLADDKSRKVWREMIEFRKTMKFDLRPKKEQSQYFVKGIINYGKREVFIDCGGFDGKTSIEFLKNMKYAGGGYKRIVLFEPDAANMKLLKKNLSRIRRVCIFQKGVWNETEKLSFCGNGSSSSRIVKKEDAAGENLITIDVVAIDEVPECKDATFIKMDLEGAELMALKGAEKTIKTNKPKLAICIYHSDEDMLEIIKYIHKLVPEYRLYVRHHSIASAETVLYAVKAR